MTPCTSMPLSLFQYIFPQVLNIASGVIQNNYQWKDNIKPLPIKKKKKYCNLPENSLCPTDSFE